MDSTTYQTYKHSKSIRYSNPKELDDNVVEIEVPVQGETVLPHEEAATLMAAFWDRVYTEFNVAKAVASREQSLSMREGGHDSAMAAVADSKDHNASKRSCNLWIHTSWSEITRSLRTQVRG